MSVGPQVFAFSGRKGSGKGVMSSLLERRGAVKVSMAGWLKNTTSYLCGVSAAQLDALKLAGAPLPQIDPSRLSILASNYPILAPYLDGLPAQTHNTRTFLQYLGTEVCRSADPEFHVKVALKTIQDLQGQGKTVVCDDVRFPNELALRGIGAHCFFVVSPWNWSLSNHPSENSVLWTDFDPEHIIFNDIPLHKLEKRYGAFFDRFLKQGAPTDEQPASVVAMAKEGLSSTDIATKLELSRDAMVWWAVRANVRFRRTEYTSDDRAFLEGTPEAAYWVGFLTADGCIKRSGNSHSRYVVEFGSVDKKAVDGFQAFVGSRKPLYVKKERMQEFNGKNYACQEYFYTVIENPLILENLKLWDVVPLKTARTTPPYMVTKNSELFYPWLRGLIDGDGSVFKTYQYGKPLPHVSVLAFSPLADWVQKTVELPCSRQDNHKDVPGLSVLSYTGQYANELTARTKGAPCLSRKWTP